MKHKIAILFTLMLALVGFSAAEANQSAVAQYCAPLNQINNGDSLNAVPVMANYNGIEECMMTYGDLFTDGPLYSPTLTTSTASLIFSIPANTWIVKGNRVYVVTTNETATASATNYYWIDIYGVVRATTTNSAPTSSSVLEYTIVTNSSGVTSVTYPAIAVPTFYNGIAANAVTSPAGMVFKINTSGTSYQFQNNTGTVIAQFNGTDSGEVGAGTISWDALGNVSVPNLLLANPLAVAQGGTGTTTPAITAGTGITITGTFPNYTISSSVSGGPNYVAANLNNAFTGTNSFSAPTTFGNVVATGPIQDIANDAGPPAPPSSNSAASALTWNGTGGGGDATLATMYNGSTTASFWKYNGSNAMIESSKILADGTYVPGTTGTQYGPSGITLIGGANMTGGLVVSNGNAGQINISGAFSGTVPVIGNSSDGGINMGVTSSSNFGLRLFSEASSSSITQLFQVSSAGQTNFGSPLGGSFQFSFNSPNTITNGMVVNVGGAAFTDTDPGVVKALSVIGNISSSGYIKSGASQINSTQIISAGNITSNNGTYLSPSGVASLQLCPNGVCDGMSINATQAVFQGTGQGTSAALYVSNGDILTARGNNTGVIFLGNTGTYYLYFDGTNYDLPSANLIVGGTVTANSSRSLKKNIQPITDPIALAMKTNFVQYCYNYEKCNVNQERHLGFIAEDTPIALSVDHKHYDIGATAAAALAGVKELEEENIELRKELRVSTVQHEPSLGERLHDFFFGT